MRYPKMPEKICVIGIEFNLRMAVILWVTVLVTMTNWHHPQFVGAWLRPFELQQYGLGAMGLGHAQLILFFLIPVAVVLLMGDNLRDYGLRIGKWKEGLFWLAVVCPLIFIMLMFLVPGGNLERLYKATYYDNRLNLSPAALQARMLYSTGILLWGWEYLLRGFCLFGLARVLGPGPAIFIQMVPFALLHLGKDEVEAMSTFASGVGFGIVAWRTQSFLYAFLIHWFMLVMTVLIATGLFS